MVAAVTLLRTQPPPVERTAATAEYRGFVEAAAGAVGKLMAVAVLVAAQVWERRGMVAAAVTARG